MMKNVSAMLLMLPLIAGCSSSKPDYLVMLTPKELNQVIQKDDVFLLDVHIPEQKHIQGTDQVIPFNEIVKYQDKLPADKNTAIYLYCKSGRMANTAAEALHQLGYGKLYNLEGGTDAWKQDGLAVQ